MNILFFINSLRSNKKIFSILFESLSENQISWKQSPEKWCPLEIICHLHHEECEDFKIRIQHVFETPHLAPPAVNPVNWVKERKYMEQDFKTKVMDFILEREKSILWLQNLQNPPWENAYLHPKFGSMSARYFLTNWLAHDYLHIKQLIRLQYDYLHDKTGLDLKYAGNWV